MRSFLGTSYGIVPFMKPDQLAMVSALVGAGGNAGAVFAGFAFYKQDWEDTLTPFKLHAGSAPCKMRSWLCEAVGARREFPELLVKRSTCEPAFQI